MGMYKLTHISVLFASGGTHVALMVCVSAESAAQAGKEHTFEVIVPTIPTTLALRHIIMPLCY